MRLGKSKFVEIGFYESLYDYVIGYYKHKGSQYYWWGGYSRVYGNIKFWV